MISNTRKKKMKVRPVGPQTRSRANSIAAIESQVVEGGMTSEKEVTSSVVPKLLKPTCSKLLKKSSNSQQCGSVSAYLAMRERQKQGIPPSPPENVPEPNLENIEEEETATVPNTRKWRGKTKMVEVHWRTRDQRPVIFLNKRGVPVSKDKKLTREFSNFLGTLAKDEVSLTFVNWHVVPDSLKKKMWDYTVDRYLIPDDDKHWVFKTINRSWRTYKSRMKARYYTKYETDVERMNNRPNEIPLEDFKVLVNYWGDESVQDLEKENKERRNSMNDPHTLGANSSAQVGENLKKGDPNAASPSAATVYLESRDREEGRTYRTAAKVQKRNSKKKKRWQRMMIRSRLLQILTWLI